MSDEHDSWFKDAFGVDLGDAAQRIKAEAQAAATQVSNVVQQVKGRVNEAIDNTVGAVSGVAQKVVDAAGGGGAGGGGASGGSPQPAQRAASGSGKFPLSGSVGNGGQNDPNDVQAVQRALRISDDGQCGPQTIAAIENFQRSIGQENPDGRVDAGGATERALAGGAQAPAKPSSMVSDVAGGLLDKSLGGASDIVDGLDDLGSRFVKAAESTLDDPSAFMAHTGPLNSPSYVNNQNPPGSLLGGGNASAGDSEFVTGAKQGELKAKVKGIYDAAKAINEIGTELEKKGVKKLWFDDEQMIQSAKNLQGAASAMVKLADAIDKWTGDSNKEALKSASTNLGYIENVIKAVDTVSKIRTMSLATENMEKKTSEKTVDEWADSVGEVFDSAGHLIDIIPKGALPGFIVDYYKGLFSAPKNYISAFKTMLKVHYGSIDKEAGLSGSSRRATDLGRTGLDWEGDLTSMFVGGYVLPKSKTSLEFQRYMVDHQTKEGVNLYKVNLAVGKAVMTAAIQRDLADDDPAKDKWIDYVGSCS